MKSNTFVLSILDLERETKSGVQYFMEEYFLKFKYNLIKNNQVGPLLKYIF